MPGFFDNLRNGAIKALAVAYNNPKITFAIVALLAVKAANAAMECPADMDELPLCEQMQQIFQFCQQVKMTGATVDGPITIQTPEGPEQFDDPEALCAVTEVLSDSLGCKF
jgi:hypothetical protein